MSGLDAERLVKACSNDSFETGITVRSRLDPVGGAGAPVKPATYEGGRFQRGRRWWGDGPGRRVVDIVVIDNEPSQANRLEEQLEANRGLMGLPEIVLDLTGAGNLPPHLPRKISSFKFPHRNADAYLRDSLLDGAPFSKTEVGRAIFGATAQNPGPLFQWFPQALLFGFWQSHLGKKGSQAKLARSWTSEIVGIDPAAADVRRFGLKGDPLNLSVAERVVGGDDLPEAWSLAEKGPKKLSDIGHGQVPVGDEGPLSGVSFDQIVQQATVSFAGLRRIRPKVGAAEGRALLVALGLLAHCAAFGRGFSLRSGADLKPSDQDWTWVGSDGDESIEPLKVDTAGELFADVVKLAEAAGLPVGTQWPEPLVLTPAPNLLDAIKKTWPVG